LEMQNFHNDAFDVEQVTTRFLDEYTKVYFDLQEDALVEVLLGVDTHLDCHVAVALDELGRRLGELTMPTTTEGYESLVGREVRSGEEGGARRDRQLRSGAGPASEGEGRRGARGRASSKRRHLRRKGKSDPIDAERTRPERSWPVRQRVCPRAAMVRWSRSAP
jgi:hypothetical protein